MVSKSKFAGLCLAALVSAGFGGAVQGSIITVGNATAPNSFPYGNSSYAGREYQQIYNATAFSGPVLINSISFPTYNLTASTAASYTMNMSMGTTTSTPGSVGTFAANSGNLTTEITGTTAPTLTPGGSLTFTFSTPYLFDPSLGKNLVLDLEMFAESFNPNNTVFFGLSNNDPNMGRIFQATDTGNPQTAGANQGLVTSFNVTSVPEPATLSLIALAGTFFAGRRSRSSR